MSVSELACTYAALILHDDGIPITAERIATLVKAANVSVESFWPTLFSKLLAKRNVDDLLLKVGTAAAPVAVAASDVTYADPADAPAAEEKEEETEAESDDDIGYGLFDD